MQILYNAIQNPIIPMQCVEYGEEIFNFRENIYANKLTVVKKND